MLTHITRHPITKEQIQTLSLFGLSADDTICLDIETTGLMPSVCALFMIGCAMINQDAKELVITQWFADGLTWDDEAAVLLAFTTFLNEHSSNACPLNLLTYNGDRFDLRFLKERFTQCKLPDPLSQDTIIPLDLMVSFKALKKLYDLKNMKLKTLADFMKLKKNQTPEGKALINAYHAYINEKDPETLDLLWQHNINDLIQTMGILPLQQTISILNGNFTVTHARIDKEFLLIEASSDCFAPLPVCLVYDSYHVTLEDNKLLFKITLHERGLRYYHTDFKNYVYLPGEDFVIPKSMASYVPACDRCKADKDHCYTWFTPDESFLDDLDKLTAYARMLSAFLIFIR